MFRMKRGIAKIFATISCRAYNYKLQTPDTSQASDGRVGGATS